MDRRIIVDFDPTDEGRSAVRRGAFLSRDTGARMAVLAVEETPLQEGEAAIAARELRDGVAAATVGLELPAAPELDVVEGRRFVEMIRAARGAWLLVTPGTADAGRILRKGDTAVLVVRKPAEGPYRRILVAVDFSGTSRRAVELALELRGAAPLHLLYVAEPAPEARLRRMGATDAQVLRWREEAVQQGREELERFAGSLPGAIETHVCYGRPGQVIREAAAALEADLIVLGTHGRTGLSHMLLGSIAEEVLRTASGDALAVRPEHFRYEAP